MRKNILALSLFEAARALREQAAPPPPAAPAPETEPSQDVPTDDETGEALTLDHILDRLNTIRSGKSFQDPEVYGKLTTLYKRITPEDKIKLNQQLRNIGAVVQNQTPVDMAKGAEQPAPEVAPEATPAAPPAPAPAPAAV
jgi:hypothetical protein